MRSGSLNQKRNAILYFSSYDEVKETVPLEDSPRCRPARLKRNSCTWLGGSTGKD